MDTSSDSVQTFLAQAEPAQGSNRFVIGAFERGVTVYKQQVRALNLIYALHTTGRLREAGTRIAVIGGGVSGVTATAAASALGYEVYIFESRPMLLHLQHGCDTRWLHPHIYDWPVDGSLRPYAGLPLLDWHEGTAAAVVEQIRRGYEAIKNKRKSGKVHEHLGATVRFSKPRRLIWRGSQGKPRASEQDFAVVIFAVGFGVEHQVDQNKTISYWRNDSLNQLKPGSRARDLTRYIISGTGDGGLIDLLRVRIQNFHQGQILYELIQREENSRLVSKLQKIVTEWNDHLTEDTWLYDQYVSLEAGHLLDQVKKRLKSRMRKDTAAALNGKAKNFSQILRLDKASLFNTLITFLLHSEEYIEYEGGEYIVDEIGYKIGDRRIGEEEVIVRHGTDRRTIFEQADFTEGILHLEGKDSLRMRIDTSGTLWRPGWWGEQAKNALSGERVEFVPPATQAIATTFISTLSDVIGLYKSSREARFRITLHRLINVNGEDFFQQISEYAGTKGSINGSKKSGRVFQASGGLVGLVCRLGQPVKVIREDEEEFRQIWEELDLSDLAARSIAAHVHALFGCPFLVPNSGRTKSKYVSLILFMDSEQKDFFTQEVMRTIYAACRGFVKNLEAMNSSGDLFFPPSEYRGYLVNSTPRDEGVLKAFKESVTTEHIEFKNFVEDLTFSSITFFDAYLK